jgi:hypothetical protein
LEWKYEPTDYLEEKLVVKRKGYQIDIDDGKAVVNVKPEFYEKNKSISEEIETDIRNILIGAKLINHKPFKLSGYSTNIYKPNGTKSILLKGHSSGMVVVSDSVDLIIKDKNGNIVGDTRRDRINRKHKMAKLAAKHLEADSVCKSIFQSYSKAVDDSDNELVHLYEIKEALTKRFGNEHDMKAFLNISSRKLSRFGQLCNDLPLNQGRHRGKNPGSLRDATSGESKEARELAKHFISSYLKFID